MKQQSVFSTTLHKNYKAVEGGLSFSVEDLHNSPFWINKMERLKAFLEKHPITVEVLNKK
jgi:hypothetical protein